MLRFGGTIKGNVVMAFADHRLPANESAGSKFPGKDPQSDYIVIIQTTKQRADLPIDYADATLVCLAAEAGIKNIATFDKKDFSIYTLPARKKFNLILD